MILVNIFFLAVVVVLYRCTVVLLTVVPLLCYNVSTEIMEILYG